MKKRKIISAMLATTMITAAASVLPVTAEDDPIIYTYTDETGTIVNITQSELDAEHWDKDALGDKAPVLYQSFPMDITGFVNDFSEISFDIMYMKKLSDMDSVTLKIQNIFNSDVIYEGEINSQSFYSSTLEVGKIYDVTLSETLNGVTTDYEKTFSVNEVAANLPDYIYNNALSNNNEAVLIKDIDSLRSGYEIDEEGKIEIDASVADYDRVYASEFAEYCSSLDHANIYRIYTNSGNDRYSGFLKFNNGTAEFYDLEIEEYEPVSLSQPSGGASIMSVPNNITLSDVEAAAQYIRLSDASFHLRENSNNSKWAAFEMEVPEDYASEDRTGTFYINISADAQITAKIWCYNGSNTTLVRTATSKNNTNSISYTITTTNYSPCVCIDFYVMVYFPSAVEGYGMISFDSRNQNGISDSYDDDVTGSISEAYNGGDSCVYSLSNTEFTMTDSWDVDAFGFDYWGTNDIVYKVEMKNRSLAEQAALENGVLGKGSSEKQLTLWNIDMGETSLEWYEDIIYTIPKNADVTIYVNPVVSDNRVLSINNKATGRLSADKYQLSFAPMS